MSEVSQNQNRLPLRQVNIMEGLVFFALAGEILWMIKLQKG
jgi:putative Ca2+/H+ antiporter (TMEM165/GDT1 family)